MRDLSEDDVEEIKAVRARGGLCWVVLLNSDYVAHWAIVELSADPHWLIRREDHGRVTRAQAAALIVAGAHWQGPSDQRP